MGSKLRRMAIAAGVALAVVAPLATAASAVVVTSAPRVGKLVQVGPIAEHGFPAWYRDSNNVRLEACVTEDPLCPVLLSEVPTPDAPISYPGNFPGEFFYQLAGAAVTLTNGVTATIGMDLEGAWATGQVVEGDQMVFGRVRIRFDAPTGQRFRITHPYGVDDLVSDDRGRVTMTEDIGTTPGAFGGALNSRIGPFLKWDPTVAPAAPTGYTGNPGVDHQVVGSPYETNFVRIEQLNPTTGVVISQLGFTDLFAVQGRYAVNAGVDLNQANYSLGVDHKGVLEVYATSEPGQAIGIVGNPALGYRNTRLRGDSHGRYYGRFPINGPIAPGTAVEVINAGDRPVPHKTKAMTDVVTINEVSYDADARSLTVRASSSDKSGPALTVTGFGLISGSPFAGVIAPPGTITVTSAAGGTSTVALVGTGQVFLPGIPVAAATADTPAIVGQNVKLDATGSTGQIDSYTWVQTSGPAVTLANASTPQATFVATLPGTYGFTLTVAGPGGTPAPVTVTVIVTGATAPRADAGTDQTVVRGRVVTLDASRSTAAETYSWRQVSGPAVTLSSGTVAKPTFSYPAQLLPAAPGPNVAFVFDNNPVVLEVTVRNPAGVSTARTTVRPQADAFTGLTVRYRTGNNEWRIAGNTTLLAGQRVTAVLGPNLNGRVIGTAAVDATGAFSIRVTGPVPGAITTVSLVSTTGARQPAFAVTVTN